MRKLNEETDIEAAVLGVEDVAWLLAVMSRRELADRLFVDGIDECLSPVVELLWGERIMIDRNLMPFESKYSRYRAPCAREPFEA
jgi:hypothetical protein